MFCRLNKLHQRGRIFLQWNTTCHRSTQRGTQNCIVANACCYSITNIEYAEQVVNTSYPVHRRQRFLKYQVVTHFNV